MDKFDETYNYIYIDIYFQIERELSSFSAEKILKRKGKERKAGCAIVKF